MHDKNYDEDYNRGSEYDDYDSIEDSLYRPSLENGSEKDKELDKEIDVCIKKGEGCLTIH